MTKLSETKCRGCNGHGEIDIVYPQLIVDHSMPRTKVCVMCNGNKYEKETVGGYAPVASINHEGRD